ncbi:multicopper oxidase domain-containing protein [Thermosulfurimonas marina]|uniref:Multicopper oxidase domain-containing protein n=1 Tax=Thermosulfurimonas marina TaxID=2047767 RepID=A0A6H1WU14_9BACT|nr:multicopper oxidase domain-containing protein [Thermosulfurimonas marina]QJA06678.1 multicopper oxidase domain-containing protein [Thermosulfurimonas marina]
MRRLGGILFLLLWASLVQARVREYHLVLEERPVTIGGRTIRAMTVNGKIPGPTLYFEEGDLARIHVENRMSEDSSIHWHGVLVPPEMDGVPYVSFPPIKPGSTFTYEFPIRQAGTYWYHSHTGLQEQRGVYGAIVVRPRRERFPVDRDYVVVLSDWTYEDPEAVLRTLKAGREWYNIKKGTAQSLLGAVRLGMLKHFFKRELLRMPPMDLSDIAYDHFLVNGGPELSLPARPGEKIRLRIINAAAGTNFYVEFAGGPMTIVSADGQEVEPVKLKRFLIVIAETYDVIVTLPREGAFEFRATAQDNTGHASLWLGEGPRVAAPTIPSPNLYHTMGRVSWRSLLALRPEEAMGMSDAAVRAGKFDRPGMMPGMKMGHTRRSTPPDLALDGMDPRRPWPPYRFLRATKPTAPPPGKPVRVLRLTLDGDMERYVWFLGKKALSESDVIRIRKGEVVRLILVNRTMMHHPMHLHGHFFRVLSGQGAYAPWKHTVDVAPMSTTVIEFPANESGDWFFHCHILYHLKSGMARVVHYEGYSPPPAVRKIRPLLYQDHWYAWAEGTLATNMSEGYLNLSNTRWNLRAVWEIGWEGVPETETEWTLLVERYFNRFFTVFAGADLLDDGEDLSRAVIGFTYLLPLNLRTYFWLDSDGGTRMGVEKHLPLTARLFLEGYAQYDTWEKWEGEVGLSYVLSKRASLRAFWHSDYFWGVGLNFWF